MHHPAELLSEPDYSVQKVKTSELRKQKSLIGFSFNLVKVIGNSNITALFGNNPDLLHQFSFFGLAYLTG